MNKATKFVLDIAREKGLKPGAFASAIGESPQTIVNWKKRGIPPEHAPKIGRLLGISTDDVMAGERRSSQFASNVQLGPDPRASNLAPVTGRVRGGDNGYIFEEDRPVGDGDELVPYFGRDANAFGLRVIGDSMSPRYNHGEYIVACPNLPYAPGKYVYVALSDGRKMVKRMASEMKDAYRFESLHPSHEMITVLKDQIEAIYVVQGPFDSDAIIHR